LERTITTDSPLTLMSRSLRRMGSALADGVDLIFTAHIRVAALNRLLAVNDAQLSARGLTREGEIARILGDRR
jgi:hypothetical protein